MGTPVSASQPLCFVLMAFGPKPDPGASIDFDRMYTHAIKPGIQDAGMFPVRADEEKLGGIMWQPQTTADNLRIIQQRRQQRGEDVGGISPLIEQLDDASGAKTAPRTSS